MKRTRSKRATSDLEGCVLGYLAKHGPSTPYAVRRSFLDSRSSHWSGSAGAVYPLLERLERSGLVESAHAGRGDRDAWRYALTPAGRRALLAWIGPPFGVDVVSIPPDPLRTRLYFLSRVPEAQRKAWIAAVIAHLRAEAAEHAKSRAADADDRIGDAMARELLAARIRAFERLARSLERAAL